jgi:hypothetical protein
VRKITAQIKSEMSVGLTPEIEAALQVAVEFVGMKPSQFARQAILEKLVREGFMRHPGMVFQNNNSNNHPGVEAAKA